MTDSGLAVMQLDRYNWGSQKGLAVLMVSGSTLLTLAWEN